jgi:hypothetical protein
MCVNFRALRRAALCGSALAATLGVSSTARAQTQLPEIVVTPPKETAKPQPKPKPQQARASPRPAPARALAAAPARPVAAAPARPAPPVNPVAATANTLNQGLNTIYAPIGTIPATIGHDTIQALPGGELTTKRRRT